MLKRAGRSTPDFQASDAAHHLHPFTDHGALNAEGSRVIVKAEGIWLWDADGRKILDGMSGLWCVNVGYGRHSIADAVHRQMTELPFYNTFFKSTHPPAVELSEKLAAIAPPHINRVFFCNSGSEANDTVIRMVRRYWALKGQPYRNVIISRQNAYHGSTMGGASLGGMGTMHAQGGLPIPGIAHIAQPYWFDDGGDMDPESFGLKAARALEAAIHQHRPENIAAFIGEPIQGAGGVIIPPDSYWPEIMRICRAHDILAVADEVICGFGRLGTWFGSEHFGIEPDLMPIAKGLSSGYLPIGGVLVSDRIADTLIKDGGEFFHGFTYSGHPAACAAALENLRIIEDENILAHAQDTAIPAFARAWQSLADHPLVGEARSAGLLGALELVPSKPSRARFPAIGDAGMICRDLAFENGLVMRAVRDTMVIAPPLVITQEEVGMLAALARKTLDDTLAVLKRERLI